MKEFGVHVLDKFSSVEEYIDTMIEMMKLNNRDPLGIKFLKVKIENNYCTLQDEKDRKNEKRRNKGKRKRKSE